MISAGDCDWYAFEMTSFVSTFKLLLLDFGRLSHVKLALLELELRHPPGGDEVSRTIVLRSLLVRYRPLVR